MTLLTQESLNRGIPSQIPNKHVPIAAGSRLKFSNKEDIVHNLHGDESVLGRTFHPNRFFFNWIIRNNKSIA